MSTSRIDKAERLIAAPAARLFSCWTDPSQLVRWLPPRGMTGRIEALDARPGGAFRLVLTYEDISKAGKSGGGRDVVEGVFVALDAPRHLAFVSRFESDDPQFQGEMQMDWHFDPAGDAVLVRIIATGVPPGISPHDHERGMTSSLSQLAKLVE